MKYRFAILISTIVSTYLSVASILLCPLNKLSIENVSEMNNDHKKIEIKIHRDSLNHKAVLLLIIQNNLLDSLVINNIDFGFDSVSVINDTLWNYIYSAYPKYPGSELYAQILVGELNNKIHLLYVGINFFSSLPCKESPYKDYFWIHKYDLNITDSIPNVIFSKWSKDTHKQTLKIDSIRMITYLKYNAKEKIYYNSVITLDSVYTFRTQKPPGAGNNYKYKPGEINDLYFNHQKVFALELGLKGYLYFNYKNKWFTLDRMCIRCIDPLRDIESKEFNH